MDEAVEVIAAAQRADGYLHTATLIAAARGDQVLPPFTDPLQFEFYNFGHLMTAACVHHACTGKTSLLDVAKKSAEYLAHEFLDQHVEIGRHAVCPAHFMGLIDLYRLTGSRRYLELTIALLESRDRVSQGTDDNQDRLPFREQQQAVGHAVRANYLYAGVADLYAETGDATLRTTLERLWHDVHARKVYVTGACGALYDGASPDGSSDQKSISRIHQAYGRAFQLPNITAHNETCAAIGNVLWNWRMLQIEGDARYADELERSLYNAVLAGMSLDGTKYFYTNTLRQLDAFPIDLRWSRQRQGYISCFCCPPNVARILAGSAQFAVSQGEDGVWFHLWGCGELNMPWGNEGKLRLTMSTDYPWTGTASILLQEVLGMEMDLNLRIPGWADSARVQVNGEEFQEAEPGTYHRIRRVWKKGDRISVAIPLRPRWLEAHPWIEELRGQVALQYGPLIYCLESPDLPKGTSILDVNVQPKSGLTVNEPSELGDCVVLSSTVVRRRSRAWEGGIFREREVGAREEIPAQFIPYFAWGNRGPSEMSVWLLEE
jgi:hypothetical protein